MPESESNQFFLGVEKKRKSQISWKNRKRGSLSQGQDRTTTSLKSLLDLMQLREMVGRRAFMENQDG